VAILDIIILPDERLHQVSEPVTKFDSELKKLATDMGETMHAANGIGLAGVQVAVMKQILVIDISEMGDEDQEESESAESRKKKKKKTSLDFVETYINPKITKSSGDIEYEEGCLSIPGVYSKVTRARNITLEYNDLEGNLIEEEASGLKAIVLQHEIDHLNGVIFFDRVGPMQRMMLNSKYKKLREQAEEDED
jgi:peptide deformylase